ncbi:MAG TPA: ribose-phosphate pyrophosphokinase [Vicinamibacterales bacterium]|nr:ribose-phosphate pyrophosphokinase [Vicinamibacterales bacterium]
MKTGLSVFAGTASQELAADITQDLGIQPGACTIQTFPDGELGVELEQSVRGHDVYLVQSTSPPVEKHAFELMLLADACHRAGAERITALVPYFGYARQDRRGSRRQALGGRVVADVLQSGAIGRLVAVDLHTPAIEGFFSIPIEHLSAVPLLADAVRPLVDDTSIVVAPDLGAVKLARSYAGLLDLPMAIVHKTRVSGREVTVQQVVGDVKGRSPIVVDDMLSTGATIEAALNAAFSAGARSPSTVVVTHGLFVGRADEILTPMGIQRVFTTNTVMPRQNRLPLDVCSLAPMLAEGIRRLHGGESLQDLYAAARARGASAGSGSDAR